MIWPRRPALVSGERRRRQAGLAVGHVLAVRHRMRTCAGVRAASCRAIRQGGAERTAVPAPAPAVAAAARWTVAAHVCRRGGRRGACGTALAGEQFEASEVTVARRLALQQCREGQRAAEACTEAYLSGEIWVQVQARYVLLLSFSNQQRQVGFFFLQVRMRDTSRRCNPSL